MMSEQTVHTLVPSTSHGRYALDDPVTGQDITSGDVLLILLGGHWTQGSVEHASGLYATGARCTTQSPAATTSWPAMAACVASAPV